MADDASQSNAASEVGGQPSGRWQDEFGMAWTFLTRFPYPFAVTHDRALMAAAWAFPVVGALIGAASAVVFGVADALGLPTLASAILAIAASALMTGALHEDGLADVADGFGGGRDAEAKRRIMRDSRIGSYGVFALIIVVGLKAAALTALAETLEAGALVAMALIASATVSRTVMPGLAHLFPFAANDGMARMAGKPSRAGAFWAAGIGAGLAVLVVPAGVGLVAAVLAAAAAYAVGWLAKRQIGGVTGDVLGAAGQVAETVALLTIAASLPAP